MRYGRSMRGLASAAALAKIVAATLLIATSPGARAFDDARYPDLKGQWVRVGHAQWDPSRPPDDGQKPPLIVEYQASYAASRADQAAGGQGNNTTPHCIPPGMPRAMIAYDPIEVIVLPDVTYIKFEFMNQFRRIYTDGRDWPQTIAPTYLGYAIGIWRDEDGDGRLDTLEVETRGFRGPRTFEGNIPLHRDNLTVVKERLRLDKANPDILHDEITTIDHALTGPWTVDRRYTRDRKPRWFEYACGEENEHVFLGKENYYLSADGTLMPARKDQPPPDLRYFKPAASR